MSSERSATFSDVNLRDVRGGGGELMSLLLVGHCWSLCMSDIGLGKCTLPALMLYSNGAAPVRAWVLLFTSILGNFVGVPAGPFGWSYLHSSGRPD